jgi:hypothetical protein
VKEISGPCLIDPLGQAHALTQPTTVLGRGADCDIVISDRQASRRHVEVCREAQGFTLRDRGSTNGTWLNGARLNAPALLQDGDAIRIGNACFTFRDPDATLENADFPRLVVDEATGDIWVNRRPIQLSAEQRALFSLLWARRGQVCSKDEIARAVWPDSKGEIYDYQIESLVKRLRLKLEPNPAQPTLLLTVRGCGYRLIG